MKNICILLMMLGYLACDAAYCATLPEYYGLYAIDGNKLIELTTKKNVELSPNAQFVFYNKVVSLVPVKLKITNMIYVRNNIDKLFDKNNTKISSINQWRPSSNVDVKEKPVPGQNEMIYVIPQAPLTSGVYEVSGGVDGSPIFTINWNEVAKNLNNGPHCVDEIVEGGWGGYAQMINSGGGKYIPCTDKSVTAAAANAVAVSGDGSAIAKKTSSVQSIGDLLKTNFALTDLTILDKSTKLMWTRDGKLKIGFLRSAAKWDDAIEFVENLNKKKYAGYSDWRMPTIKELKTLVSYATQRGSKMGIAEFGQDPRRESNANETFSEIGFTNVKADVKYWSSSKASDTSKVQVVSMDGYGGNEDKSYYFQIWPVRSDNSQGKR